MEYVKNTNSMTQGCRVFPLDEVMEFTMIMEEYEKCRNIIDKDFYFVKYICLAGENGPIKYGTFRRRDFTARMLKMGWLGGL